MKGILSGMRVVEVSAFVAAPSGGLTLAQMGAEVIRIDNIGGGLDYRRWPVTNDNVSLFWRGLNKSKRSVALNIRTPEGQDLARQIICAPGDDAGMLLTNFPPKGWLSYDELIKQRADLIQLTVQGDRQGGSAVDYTVNPAIGMTHITGPVNDDTPVNHVLPAWDCITGQMAVTALLAAERHRSRTGQGQHVKLALEDVALATMANLGFIAEAELGIKRERVGNYLFGAFGRDFVCADGVRIMIVGLTPKQWSGLCKATGLVDEMSALAERLELDLKQEGNRFRARSEIAELLEPWIAARCFAEVEEAFAGHGVCWSRYQSVQEMLELYPNASLQNPMFERINQPEVGEYMAPGTPMDFEAIDRDAVESAPVLGEHTDQVLSDLLGLSSGAIGKLHDQKIIALS